MNLIFIKSSFTLYIDLKKKFYISKIFLLTFTAAKIIFYYLLLLK